jgi:hypothetical protein
LVLKTVALTDVLRAALAPLARNIRAAFVYGSIAKGEDTATRAKGRSHDLFAEGVGETREKGQCVREASIGAVETVADWRRE